MDNVFDNNMQNEQDGYLIPNDAYDPNYQVQKEYNYSGYGSVDFEDSFILDEDWADKYLFPNDNQSFYTNDGNFVNNQFDSRSEQFNGPQVDNTFNPYSQQLGYPNFIQPAPYMFIMPIPYPVSFDKDMPKIDGANYPFYPYSMFPYPYANNQNMYTQLSKSDNTQEDKKDEKNNSKKSKSSHNEKNYDKYISLDKKAKNEETKKKGNKKPCKHVRGKHEKKVKSELRKKIPVLSVFTEDTTPPESEQFVQDLDNSSDFDLNVINDVLDNCNVVPDNVIDSAFDYGFDYDVDSSAPAQSPIIEGKLKNNVTSKDAQSEICDNFEDEKNTVFDLNKLHPNTYYELLSDIVCQITKTKNKRFIFTRYNSNKTIMFFSDEDNRIYSINKKKFNEFL